MNTNILIRKVEIKIKIKLNIRPVLWYLLVRNFFSENKSREI